MMARRDATDPREQGLAPNWAFSWPANRRIMYNRASADPCGQAWNPAKPLIQWNGSALGRHRRARLCADRQAGSRCRAVHHAGRRHGAAVRARPDARGAVPRTLRAVRKPGRRTRCTRKCAANPVARVFAGDAADFGSGGKVPLRRHHLSPDRAFPLLDQAREDQRDPAAGGVHRDRRGAGEGKGHRAGRLGEAVVEPRLRHGQGLCHQAAQADDGRRQGDAHRSACRSIGASPALRARASAPTC